MNFIKKHWNGIFLIGLLFGLVEQSSTASNFEAVLASPVLLDQWIAEYERKQNIDFAYNSMSSVLFAAIIIGSIDLAWWGIRDQELKNIPLDGKLNLIPSEKERIAFLQEKFSKEMLRKDLFVLARMTSNWSYGKLTKFVDEIKKESGSSPIGANHVNMAYQNLTQGLQSKESLMFSLRQKINSFFYGDKDRRKVAIHEAGHIVSGVYNRSFLNILGASIDQRGNYLGFVSNSFQKESINNINYRELYNHVLMLLSGAVAEQIFGLSSYSQKLLIDESQILQFFDNETYRFDLEGVRSIVKNLFSSVNGSSTEEQIKEKFDETIIHFYPKVYESILNYKDEVQQIADLLLKKGTVSMDEINELLGVAKQKYDFEEESVIVGLE